MKSDHPLFIKLVKLLLLNKQIDIIMVENNRKFDFELKEYYTK